jgi:hypothetical protein
MSKHEVRHNLLHSYCLVKFVQLLLAREGRAHDKWEKFH